MQNQSSSYLEKKHPKKQCTKIYSNIANEEEIRHRTSRILKDLSKVLKSLHNNGRVFNYDSKVITAKPCDLIRVVSGWSQKDTLDLTIRNIIISSILTAENRQAGSGMVCAAKLISPGSQKDTHTKRATLDRRATPKDIEDALKYMLGEQGVVFDLMKELIFSGGMAADLKFQIHRGNNFLIQLASTQEMIGEIHPLFEPHVQQLEDVVVIGVDGMIESMGEIDHILQDISSSKVPALILATGFSPDIVTTLSANWKNNTVRMLPYIVKLWQTSETHQAQTVGSITDALEGCQKMNIKCISSVTGETLLGASLSDFTQHKVVFINKNKIAFEAQEGSSLYAEIKIPQRLASVVGVIKDRCQIAQKVCIGIARSGVCDDQTAKNIKNLTLNRTLKVSYTADVIGRKAAKSCLEMLDNLSSIIINE